MASLLSFMCVILCFALTLEVGDSARNLKNVRNLAQAPPQMPRSERDLYVGGRKGGRSLAQAPPQMPQNEWDLYVGGGKGGRNLGGLPPLPDLPFDLSKLPLPDLSKFGLPPLPDLSGVLNIPKQLASSGSATPNARNLGGLSGLPKPDLSKFGLPPLPDLSGLFNIPKEIASGLSATPNARNLGVLPGLQKPDFSRFGFPKHDFPTPLDFTKRFTSGGATMQNGRNLGGLPELPDLPIGLPIELPKVELPFGIKKPDLSAFLSDLFAKKLDYEDLKREHREEFEEAPPAPPPAPTPSQQPKKYPSTDQQKTPSTNTGNKKPMNQGTTSMNIGQKPKPMNQGMSNGKTRQQGQKNQGIPGQPMNQGMTHTMSTHDISNKPLNTPVQPKNPGRTPHEGNERPNARRRRLY